jgi:hypothetical protein
MSIKGPRLDLQQSFSNPAAARISTSRFTALRSRWRRRALSAIDPGSSLTALNKIYTGCSYQLQNILRIFTSDDILDRDAFTLIQTSSQFPSPTEEFYFSAGGNRQLNHVKRSLGQTQRVAGSCIPLD